MCIVVEPIVATGHPAEIYYSNEITASVGMAASVACIHVGRDVAGAVLLKP